MTLVLHICEELDEPPLPESLAIRRIEVRHPKRLRRRLGLPWWLWWLIGASGAAVALRGRMRVIL